MANPWSTGLCDCFTDCNSCCLTYWCPCVAFGRVAEIVDKGTSSCCANGTIYCLLSFVTGWGCLYSCYFRSKMREQYMLKGSSCGDCMVHVFCEICALCQEYRELENRGYDLSLGWHGNLERQNKGVVMAPKVEGDMKR